MSITSRKHSYLLSIILVIYVILSLYQINLPGLHYDEAFEAVPALQLLLGQPVTAFRESGLTLGGYKLPFMTQDYIGTINTYFAIPFILIFGSTPAAIRVMSIIFGAVTVWLTYAVVNILTSNRWVGLGAALLLAVDPTFIFWNRQGVFVTAVTATIGLAATLCWLRRLQGGLIGWTVVGAFMLGLGLYAKLLFLWLIVALFGAVFLLEFPKIVKQRAKGLANWRVSKAEIYGSMIAFLFGCWPLIAYNVQTGGTILSVIQNADRSYYGVNNLALGNNLVERLKQFGVVLSGGHLWYLGKVISNPLPIFTVGIVLSLVMIVIMTTRKSSGEPPAKTPILSKTLPLNTTTKTVLFPFLVIGLVILASIGTVSALWVTHFAILMPWPAIAISVGTWFIFLSNTDIMAACAARLSLPGLATQTLIWVGLGLLATSNLVSVVRYHLTLAESGGLSGHSDAVYDLSNWLERHANGPVVAMDWGLAAPVTYLSHGQIEPTEVFGYDWEATEELTDRLDSFVTEPTTLYLWRAPDEIIFDRSQDFKALYRPLELQETIEAAFYEKNGRPVLGVTRLVKCGTAGVISPEPADHCP